jgi:hypothetical protein
MTMIAQGTFEVAIVPAEAELEGRIARFTLGKHFDGDLVGVGSGIMLSGGDPATGSAGYVAVEVITGTLGGRTGNFAMMQLGTMEQGASELTYRVIPGSGSGELIGINGALTLRVDAEGAHYYELAYALPSH